MVEQSGARTIAAVPMIRDGELVGAIAIYRQQVRPFTDKQIEVVKNFAAEAVIAIENARLFEAEQQRTREPTEAARAADGVSPARHLWHGPGADRRPHASTY
jgi:GAF domain-containing protein